MVVELARDMAVGLSFLHARGVLHGALSPSNVLLRRESAALSGFCPLL
jgi:serine/threonine protein kinase